MPNRYLDILHLVAAGEITPDEALRRMGQAPFEQLMQGLNLDKQRGLRTGLGEVVFAQGKRLPDLLAAVESLHGREDPHEPVLVTRVSPEQGEALLEKFPAGCLCEKGRLFSLGKDLSLAPPWSPQGDVIIVTAGGADFQVGMEALGTARFFDLNAGFIPDVGIAGLHRLLPYLPDLGRARLIIAVAGMEGALPGVLAGLFPAPVLAVPSSIGYGISAGGYTALAGMLASCAAGLAVLN
ncbi:MAG: nickel pincer cofactor biosynthesis protein LarB, partial [Desulfovibrionaceae bacterium]|nr:nickel pincer cofactor biosynthesis protein LarB [Desulfovibrionaceae bacterium]